MAGGRKPRGDSRRQLSDGAKLRWVLACGKNDVELRSTGQMRTSAPTWFVVIDAL